MLHFRLGLVPLLAMLSARICCGASDTQSAATQPASQPEEAPSQVVARLVNLLRDKNVDEARQLVLKMEKPAEEDATGARLQRMAEVLAFMTRADVVEEKSREGVAVVVLAFERRGMPDQIQLDPQMLVQRDGRWLNLIDRPYYYKDVSAHERAQIDELRDWFNSNKDDILKRAK